MGQYFGSCESAYVDLDWGKAMIEAEDSGMHVIKIQMQRVGDDIPAVRQYMLTMDKGDVIEGFNIVDGEVTIKPKDGPRKVRKLEDQQCIKNSTRRDGRLP